MLRWRLFTAAVAIPFLLWLIYRAPVPYLKIFVLAMTFIALREYSAMALGKVRGATTAVTAGGMTIAVAVALGGSGTGPQFSAVSAGIVLCLCGVLIGTLATAKDMERSVSHAGQILLGCLYAGLLLPHFICVRELPETGPGWVTFILACVMAGDAGGYFGGRAFGKHKLWPAVSPKKTVEGSISSFFASLVVGTLAADIVLPPMGWLELSFVCAVVNVLAQLGDLLESMLKRAHHATDSGWIFPGHGGVLDRTDSLVLPVVFIYYYAILTHGVPAPF
jgi:phosphatidate cytidylyltransferase